MEKSYLYYSLGSVSHKREVEKGNLSVVLCLYFKDIFTWVIFFLNVSFVLENRLGNVLHLHE